MKLSNSSLSNHGQDIDYEEFKHETSIKKPDQLNLGPDNLADDQEYMPCKAMGRNGGQRPPVSMDYHNAAI